MLDKREQLMKTRDEELEKLKAALADDKEKPSKKQGSKDAQLAEAPVGTKAPLNGKVSQNKTGTAPPSQQNRTRTGPPSKSAQHPSSEKKKRKVPLRKVRKAFAKVTGVHGAFTKPSEKGLLKPPPSSTRPPPKGKASSPADKQGRPPIKSGPPLKGTRPNSKPVPPGGPFPKSATPAPMGGLPPRTSTPPTNGMNPAERPPQRSGGLPSRGGPPPRRGPPPMNGMKPDGRPSPRQDPATAIPEPPLPTEKGEGAASEE